MTKTKNVVTSVYCRFNVKCGEARNPDTIANPGIIANKNNDSKPGIPTGNCISRQIADCHNMHYIVIKKIAPRMPVLWKLIKNSGGASLMTSWESGMEQYVSWLIENLYN